MKKSLPLVIALLVLACARKESVDLLKTVASEVKEKPRVIVSVKLDGEQPTKAESALQKTIEDRIEQSHIGRLVRSGSDAGVMTIVVEVENTADAIAQLRRILQDAGVVNRAAFKIEQ